MSSIIMAILNRFFAVEVSDPNIDAIINIAVGGSLVRKRYDGLWAVIKLPSGDSNNYAELQKYVEYTFQEIGVFLSSSDWALPDLITP